VNDDIGNRGPADRSRISLEEVWEVRWWTESLRVSEDELRKAVAAVGNSATAVREHLGEVTLSSEAARPSIDICNSIDSVDDTAIAIPR
jgi:uncharacterized protein DUF3606